MFLPVYMRYKRISPLAITPRYSTEGAGCFDLFTAEDAVFNADGFADVGTGIAFEVPSGWALKVYSRSGMGFRVGLRLANCVGIIDSDYRGEVRLALQADRELPYTTVKAGTALAQAALVPLPHVLFEEVDELASTERGSAGFGSTGGL